LTGGAALAVALRLVGVHFFHGTTVYMGLIVPWTQAVLALWIVGFLAVVCRKFPGLARRCTENAVWKVVDALSYEVYLVHYMFLVGPFLLPTSRPLWGSAGFFVLSFAAAFALYIAAHLPAIVRKRKIFQGEVIYGHPRSQTCRHRRREAAGANRTDRAHLG
jgi:peptidoglycan/LPS O-acetylase OafA/YrhL